MLQAREIGLCLWGFGGVQCVPVGHPLDQAGWDQLALSGSQFAWLFFFSFFLLFKLPPLEPSWYSPALNDTESVCAEPLFVIPACETKIRAKNSSFRVSVITLSVSCRYRVFAGLPQTEGDEGKWRKKKRKKKSVVSRPRSDHVSSPHLISLKRVN